MMTGAYEPGRDGRDWPGINARPAGRCRDGPADRPRRSLAGLVRRHVGAPYDLLAAFLSVREDRLRAILAHWRKAGYADTGRLGPGPGWCWLTRPGLAVTGLGFAPGVPALARLRAVQAVRLSLESGDGWQQAGAHWRSERRIRAAMSGRLPSGHVPDAEVPGSPYPGERPPAGGGAVTIWWLIRLRVAMWALKTVGKLAKWLLTAAILVAAWPVTVAAAVGFAGAWLWGWPPARLYRAAL